MKKLRFFSLILVISGCMTVMARAGPAEDQKASAIQSIQQAPIPSLAEQSFAAASAQYADDPDVLSAYVNRMAELRAPELAYPQARTLADLQPENGLAWIVVASADMRRGLMSDAITAGAKAAVAEPDNPLVQKTAGHLLAWYDVMGQQVPLSPSAQADAETIRNELGATALFAQAYNFTLQAFVAQANYNPMNPMNGPYGYPGTPYDQTEEQAYPTENYPNYADYSGDNGYGYGDNGYGYGDNGYGYGDWGGWGGWGWGGWWPWWNWWSPFGFNHFHHHFNHRFDHRDFNHRFDHRDFNHHAFNRNHNMHNMHNMNRGGMHHGGGMHGGMRGGGMHGGMGGMHGGMHAGGGGHGGGGHGGGGGGGHR